MNGRQIADIASKLHVRKEFVKYNSAAPIAHTDVDYVTKRRRREAFKELAMAIGMDLAEV